MYIHLHYWNTYVCTYIYTIGTHTYVHTFILLEHIRMYIHLYYWNTYVCTYIYTIGTHTYVHTFILLEHIRMYIHLYYWNTYIFVDMNLLKYILLSLQILPNYSNLLLVGCHVIIKQGLHTSDICTCIHTYIRTYICIHIPTYVYMYMQICGYVRMWMQKREKSQIYSLSIQHMYVRICS